MYILLVGNYENDRQESMQRFANMLLSGLQGVAVAAEIIRPLPCLGRFSNSAQGLGKWLGYIDKFVLFPGRLRRRIAELKYDLKADSKNRATRCLVHICDHSNAVYTRSLQGTPHLVTCHDMLAVRSATGEFHENRTRWSGRILQKYILAGVQRADHVTCVSEATRRDILKVLGETRGGVSVIRNGLNDRFEPLHPEQVRITLGEVFSRVAKTAPQRYLFHIGGNQWYKNRRGLIETYTRIAEEMSDPPALVLAGKELPLELRELMHSVPAAGRIFHVGSVSNQELNALYSGAVALFFPSLAEGFGWPLIEAQAAGCPIITTDRPPMNEICGPGALLIQPSDPKQAGRKIREFINMDQIERQRVSNLGIENARNYAASEMIKNYVNLYSRILAEHVNA